MLINKDCILACTQTFEVVLLFSLFYSLVYSRQVISALCVQTSLHLVGPTYTQFC